MAAVITSYSIHYTKLYDITPKDYTRMGVTIRHLTRLLNEVEARTKLLVTLSDGKPDDYDTYRGRNNFV